MVAYMVTGYKKHTAAKGDHSKTFDDALLRVVVTSEKALLSRVKFDRNSTLKIRLVYLTLL